MNEMNRNENVSNNNCSATKTKIASNNILDESAATKIVSVIPRERFVTSSYIPKY